MIFEWDNQNPSILTIHFRFEVLDEHVQVLGKVEGIEKVLHFSRYSIKMDTGGAFSQKEIEDNIKQLFD